MSKRNLKKMIEKAYFDEQIYDYLKKNHDLQWQKVVNKIVKKHFATIKTNRK